MLLANHVSLEDIATMLAAQAENTSIYASRQMGVRAASFGVSLPAILTGGLSENASNSYGTNHSTGVAAGPGNHRWGGQHRRPGALPWVMPARAAGRTRSGSLKPTRLAIRPPPVRRISDGVANTHGVTVTDGSSHTDSSGFASSHSDSSGYGVNGGVGGSIAPAGVGLSGNVGGNASWGSSDGVHRSAAVRRIPLRIRSRPAMPPPTSHGDHPQPVADQFVQPFGLPLRGLDDLRRGDRFGRGHQQHRPAPRAMPIRSAPPARSRTPAASAR